MGRDHIGGSVERNLNRPNDDELPGDIGGSVNNVGGRREKCIRLRVQHLDNNASPECPSDTDYLHPDRIDDVGFGPCLDPSQIRYKAPARLSRVKASALAMTSAKIPTAPAITCTNRQHRCPSRCQTMRTAACKRSCRNVEHPGSWCDRHQQRSSQEQQERLKLDHHSPHPGTVQRHPLGIRAATIWSSGRSLLDNPSMTPARSAALRFWLTFRLASHLVIGMRRPTIDLSCAWMKSAGASGTAQRSFCDCSCRSVSRLTMSSNRSASSKNSTGP